MDNVPEDDSFFSSSTTTNTGNKGKTEPNPCFSATAMNDRITALEKQMADMSDG